MAYLFKKQYRTVGSSCHVLCVNHWNWQQYIPQCSQLKCFKYSVIRSSSTRPSSMTSPLSPPSPDTDSTWCGKRSGTNWSLGKTALKSNKTSFQVLVLDLDETLIHSHHDGVVRPTVKPGTPPDFILKVFTFQTLEFMVQNSYSKFHDMEFILPI